MYTHAISFLQSPLLLHIFIKIPIILSDTFFNRMYSSSNTGKVLKIRPEDEEEGSDLSPPNMPRHCHTHDMSKTIKLKDKKGAK
jgi:hypothetical protein